MKVFVTKYNFSKTGGGLDTKYDYNGITFKEFISFAKNFLNDIFPLNNGDFTKIISFQINNGDLDIKLNNNDITSLKNVSQFIGYTGNPNYPTSILLLNNDLHIEILIDKKSDVGKTDPAGIKDILIESAITTIQDCEDSVAAVDGEDKVLVYRNWLGLMKGTLNTEFEKKGKKYLRKLNPDRSFFTTKGEKKKLHGRSLLLIRNVGHLMTNPAIILNSVVLPLPLGPNSPFIF